VVLYIYVMMILLETQFPEHLTTQEIVVGICFFAVLGIIVLFRHVTIFRPIFKIVLLFLAVLGIKFGAGYLKDKL